MFEKLEHIVAYAYMNRCQYNTYESIKSNVCESLQAYGLDVSFHIMTTGVEFVEEIFKYGMSGELPKHSRTEVYFIRY